MVLQNVSTQNTFSYVEYCEKFSFEKLTCFGLDIFDFWFWRDLAPLFDVPDFLSGPRRFGASKSSRTLIKFENVAYRVFGEIYIF